MAATPIAEAADIAVAKQRRIAQIPLDTNAGGESAVVDLHAGPTGYYPVAKLLGIISSIADAATNMNFTVTGGALVGPATRAIALEAHTYLDLNGMQLWNLTDGSTLHARLTAGPVSGTIWLFYEYWSET